jgi:chemotaxis protein CheZ
MANDGLYQDKIGFEQALQNHADALVDLLAKGDMNAAMRQIQSLNEMRHQALYHEVGRLTRAVHNTIISFTDDVTSAGLLEDSKVQIASISDASDRLSYVIELSESNAHKTIDSVDESLLLVAELEQGFLHRTQLLAEFESIKSGNPQLEALYDKAFASAGNHSQALAGIKSNMTDILLAQEYQDITGQLIKRVIQLVSDIEDELVGLMEVASRVNSITGLKFDSAPEEQAAMGSVKAEGPQLAGKPAVNVASSQDEVDDLLSSLGF